MSYFISEAAPLEYYTSKRGKEGWPVVAHQIAINSHFNPAVLSLDGVFGPATEKAAKELQTALKITADGIVGPETQEAFTIAKMKHAEKGTTPPGLCSGVCKIESSFEWACVSTLNSNNSHDYGVTQESLVRPEEWQLFAAFNPDAAGHVLATELLGFHRAVVGKVSSGKRSWELAALNHNWPAAAWALAEGNEAWLNKPFTFTTSKGYATGLDYANHYIAVATSLVTSWIVV